MPPKEQYVTIREFTIFKQELKEWSDRIHEKAREIVSINAKLEAQEDIGIKLDKLYNAFIDFKESYARESVNCSNNTKEIDTIKKIIKDDLVNKEDLRHLLTETKSQKIVWGIVCGAVGVVVAFILLAVLGSQMAK